MHDGWVEATLREALEPIANRPNGKDYPLVLSVTEKRGIIPQTEIFNHRIATDDISKYKVLEPMDIAYNPYLLWCGAIGQWQGTEAGVVSPVYECFRVKSNCEPRYLGYIFESGILTNYFDALAIGSIVRRRRTIPSDFIAAPIQLPPLPEQKRIVDLISSIDAYIKALQQQLESAKKSRNAVLHKTFHIQGSNWKLQKLDECTQKISDGSHNPPKGIEEGEFLMLSSKDVWDGYLTNLDPRFLKQSDFELENKRTQVEIGDVLLTVVGTIGRCAVYRGYPKNVTFQRSVCVIKTSKDILNESFLMMYLQSIQSYLDQNARGVAQRGIYLNQIRDLEIPILALNEQLEVVSNIDVFDTFIQETQKVVAQTQKLRTTILSDLLSGEHEIPSTYDKVIGAA